MHDFFYNRTVIIPQLISITLIHISLVSLWEINFVDCIPMLKYAIHRIINAFFHTKTVIMPRPISTLGLNPSGRNWYLGLITVLIWIRACINL